MSIEPAARAGGLARLVHPFPSTLDATVVGALALLAGADPARSLHLALSMLALQLAIGAANDWADAPADAVSRPTKPIPAGLVGRRHAAAVAVGAAATGLALAALLGPAALAIAALGLGTGLAYDLRLKGTRWSWLPYAVGIPLLPAYAWVGATGTLPAVFLLLVPIATAAGAALAVANALADLERDEAAGTETVATALGARRTWLVGAILQGAVVAVAVGSAMALGGEPGTILVSLAGGALVAAGLALAGRSSPPARQRGWELQGIGLGVLAVGWVGAVVVVGVAG